MATSSDILTRLEKHIQQSFDEGYEYESEFLEEVAEYIRKLEKDNND